MCGKPELHPHPTGPWLLRIDGRVFGVDPALGRRLLESGSNGEWTRLIADGVGDGRRRRRVMWLRVTLLPARLVVAVSARLRPLAGWPALFLQLGLGAALMAYGLGAGLSSGLQHWPLALIGLSALNLLHEFGHAAALFRTGYPPGRIGAGVLLVMPVLFCDVSAVGLLPRLDRLRVDAAGICVQTLAGGLLGALGRRAELPVLQLVAGGSLLSTLWSLLPFMKVDGYWLMCDALGIRGMTGTGLRGRGRLVRVAFVAYRLMYALFLSRLVLSMVRVLIRLARDRTFMTTPG